jgi:hypothetical protein
LKKTYSEIIFSYLNDHFFQFFLISGSKHDITKCDLKLHIITLFFDFLGQQPLEKNLETSYFISTRQGLSIGVWIGISFRKKFLVNFRPFGGPLPKKSQNFFLNKIWQFIHQSIALVELIWNKMFPNFFRVVVGLKSKKTALKYKKLRNFDHEFKKIYGQTLRFYWCLC